MKALKRDTMRLGWMDFGLSALASCLAVFSIGMGLRVPEVSWFFVGWILAGTVFSFAVSRLIPEKHTWVSGLLYSIMAIGSVAYAQSLNSILPKQGFPIQLIIGASLAWMLVFGSFLTWRDSTIVFQAVPSIALFGLVGAWDTFTGAPFAFFGFLLCFATLFARAHGRTMILQAEDSGFATAAGLLEDAATPATLVERLKRGPWKWMAGPEWALGSAAVIVFLSVLGAPVFQTSVQGVAGFVQITMPRSAANLGSVASGFSQTTTGNVNVGQGPRGNLTKREVFKIKMTYAGRRRSPAPQYLRLRTYDQYTGRGWRPVGEYPTHNQMLEDRASDDSFFNRAKEELDPFHRISFDLDLIDAPADGIPIPGELDSFSGLSAYVTRMDGTARFQDTGPRPPSFGGLTRISASETDPIDAKKSGVPAIYRNAEQRLSDTGRVRALTQNVIKDATSDFEKARAIKRAIAERVTYDLQAPGVPAGQDPVEWFLFEGKSGYCDLYATAMTVMARQAGLPARYVTGYYPALGVRDRERKWVLHESEAHAWCEIFFEGHGWVVFDATEGSQEVGDPTASEPLMERGWFRALLFTVVGLGAIFVPVAAAYVIRLRRPGADPARHELGRQYARFVKGLEKATGKPKRPSQTPQEYMETVRDLLPHGAAEVDALTEKFEVGMFAPDGAEQIDLGSLRREVSDAIRTVRGK